MRSTSRAKGASARFAAINPHNVACTAMPIAAIYEPWSMPLAGKWPSEINVPASPNTGAKSAAWFNVRAAISA